MHPRYSSSLCALLLLPALQAQPTLTQATNAPVPGLSFNLNYSPIADPGSAGPDASWDFSTLVVDSTDLVQWVLPSETPNGPLFPTATVAELWDVISYSQVTATGLYVVGGDEQGAIVTYSDSRQALPFPCTYQTTWDDDYEGAYTVIGLPVVRTGNYGGTADGYGTLQMPWGTVPDVLRIHIVAHQEDVTDFGTVYLDIDAYQYFIAGSAWPVVEVTSATASSIGGTFTNEYTLWRQDLGTSVSSVVASTEALQAWPNPVMNTLSVAWNAAGQRTISIFDARGRVVRNTSTNNTLHVLDMTDLAPGLYTLRCTNTAGSIEQRFVKD